MDIIGKILITIIILCLIILINIETKEQFTENNYESKNENINSVFSNYDIDYNYDWIKKIPITSEENSNKKKIYKDYDINFLNNNKISYNPITAEKLFYNKINFISKI